MVKHHSPHLLWQVTTMMLKPHQRRMSQLKNQHYPHLLRQVTTTLLATASRKTQRHHPANLLLKRNRWSWMRHSPSSTNCSLILIKINKRLQRKLTKPLLTLVLTLLTPMLYTKGKKTLPVSWSATLSRKSWRKRFAQSVRITVASG